MKYLLDTSIIIDYLRGKKETIHLLDSLKGELTSSYICLAELFEGIYRVKNKKEAREITLYFFASLSNIYSINLSITEKFGEIRAILKKKGIILEDLDVLIAATCISSKNILITNNKKHFSRINELKIYKLP